MNTSSLRLLLTFAALAGFATGAAAQTPSTPRTAPVAPVASTPKIKRTNSQFDEANATTARIGFSDPAKPGTFKLSLPWGTIRVSGSDGPEVVVTSSLQRKQEREEVDAEGFRRLDEDLTFDLTEKNNVVSLALAGGHRWLSHGAEFRIQVPRQTHLVLRTQMGGDVSITDIDGDIDINSMNGEVTLTDIGSCAVVNTMNGQVRATFRRAPLKPVSITSMNGEVDVLLPADTAANIRLRTHNGSIRTNFPAERLKTTATDQTSRVRHTRVINSEEAREVIEAVREAAQVAREIAREVAREAAQGIREGLGDDASGVAPVAPVPPVPPSIGGGKSITGTLNGGGVDVSLSTMNGTITLRQGK